VSGLFGSDSLVNGPELVRMLTRLLLDLACASVAIRLVYYRLYRNRDYVFTYYLFNLITFCLCFVLRKVSTHIGLALALFGVFGILRYRTEQIRIRDLTYLFIVIGIGVLNAFGDTNVSLAELLTVNAVILGLTALLELRGARAQEQTTVMHYDQLGLLRPGNESRLVDDIVERTGLVVIRIEVLRFDLLRDAAEISITHRKTR
jgi:Domain of unknown function (DUF4956)